MMKFVILAVVLAVAMGRPQDAAPADGTKPVVTIVSSTNTDDGKGGFQWSFMNSDGSQAQQEGHTVAPVAGSTDSIQVIQGSYSYVGPDGKTYAITYVADQNGFQPKGDFLPTPPTDPNNLYAAAASQAGAEPAPAARR